MLKRLFIVIFLILLEFIIGCVGYMSIEHWNLEDSAYMTVITLASVGFGEVHPLHSSGRLFTSILIIAGMGVLVYGISTITAFIVEGDLQKLIWRKKMDREIENMKDHYIICGAGKVGQHILAELLKSSYPVVVIEKEENIIERLIEQKVHFIMGDATEDSILEKAGIIRAKGLLASLASDKDNLFVVLTARSMNPDLRIVTKAEEDGTWSKMERAGANGIVSPHLIGGLRMASEMIRPKVVNFLDTMLREEGSVLRLEEATVPPNSPWIGKTLADARVPQRTGLIIVALRRNDKHHFNPPATMILESNDTFIVIGTIDQARKLKDYLLRA